MTIPEITTERLTIRSLRLDDLDAVHALLDHDKGQTGGTREDREAWLRWTVTSYREYDRLGQPPYGERAVTLNSTGELVGAVGVVPMLMPFEQLPYYGRDSRQILSTAEVGLFWTIHSAYRGQGFATEAGHALIDWLFRHLRLARILASTDYDNGASQAVMRKLGMTLQRNPHDKPEWFQVVGILDHTAYQQWITQKENRVDSQN